MIRRFWFAAVLSMFPICSALHATPTGESISINFGAEQPDGDLVSAVTGPAGLAGTANWNNLEGSAGGPESLIMDVSGASVPSTATISWISNNTWSSTGNGEENNTAPDGGDRNLMTGYLDTTDTSVTEVVVEGLDDVFSDGYNVAIYIQGGVDGRGGQYTIQTESKISTLNLVQDGPFDGTYVPGGEAGNNFIIMSGFTDPNFVLTATPAVGDPERAPINGIEIVHVVIPEPSSLTLFALALAGLVSATGRRWAR